MAEFLEIYGLPVRLGKYPAGASDKEKTTLLNALVGIGHNAAGIIPETMMLELLDAASGSGDTVMAMTDWCERTQSKIILGGTLTTQADGKTSTNALGQIHNEVRHDLLASDAKQLAATLTRQLIAPLLYLNKGITESSIKVSRNDIEDDNIGIYAPLVTELGRAAAVFADELVFGLLKKGNTTLCYDGQNFFDTDHPVFEKVDGTGNKTLVKNLFTATGGTQGTPWYLLDTSRAIKPMIFQQSKPMKLSAMTQDDDEGVLMRNE